MNIINSVLLARLPEALAKLNKLDKKAAKYGHAPITFTVSAEREEVREVPGEYGSRKLKVKVVDITMTGLVEAPKVGNFTFMAKIEILPGGNIIDKATNEELPEDFRHAKGDCDHCNHNRARKHIFIVKDEDDVLHSIGGTCLRDYMGTDTPESILWKFKGIAEARGLSERFGSYVPENHTEELLAVTSAVIRIWGWVPKSAADENSVATCNKIGPWFYCHPSDKSGQEILEKLRGELNESDWDTARAAREWVINSDNNSDYFHNLRVILTADSVEDKRRGYACSAVSGYLKHLGNELFKKTETSTSEFVGEIGERLRDLEVECTMTRGISSAWGEGILYKFKDAKGNNYTWFASSSKGVAVGEKLKLVGSVKAHKEFNNIKETQLTRVKV